VRIDVGNYFDNVSKELWYYHIMGYQVLDKYLKDCKGKSLEVPIRYSRIFTALAKTIEGQREIDGLYSLVDVSGIGDYKEV